MIVSLGGGKNDEKEQTAEGPHCWNTPGKNIVKRYFWIDITPILFYFHHDKNLSTSVIYIDTLKHIEHIWFIKKL